MFPYLIFLLFFFCFSFTILRKTYFSQVRSISIFIFFTLFLFSALRYDVGMDYQNYEAMFYGESNINELGFSLFYRFLRFLGCDFQVVCIIMAFFTMYYVYKFINSYTCYYFLSILIFYSVGQFYFNSFNAMRQVLVSYIFLANLHLIYKKKIIKYSFMCIFCMFFIHKTAIILLPLYFVFNKNIFRYIKVILLLSPFVIVKFLNIIISRTSYAIYLKFDNYANGMSLVTYLLIFFSFIIFLVDFYDTERENELNVLYNVNFILLIIFEFCILLAGNPLIMVFNRISYYFSPILIVLIPLVIWKVKKSFNRGLLVCCLSCFFTGLSFITLIMNGVSNHLVPYKTILYKL